MSALTAVSEKTSAKKKDQAKFYEHLKIDEQRELFLWKFPEISREIVLIEEAAFIKANRTGTGELDEHEAAMLLEDRDMTKTAKELRDMFAEIDKDGNHHISFVEWCCCFFEKSYATLNDFTDEAARNAALASAKEQGEKAASVQSEIDAMNKKREEEAAERARKIEDEQKLTGVAGKAAFFFRQVEDKSDKSKSNKEMIQEDFQKRKALREAKAAEAAATATAATSKTPEEVAEELYKSARRASMVRHSSEQMKTEMEKQERLMRKEAMNAKWGASSTKSP